MSQEKLENQKGPTGGMFAWVIWAVTSLFYLYEYFLRVAPSVMVHPIMLHFDITAASLGALAACYYLAYSPMQIVVGILLDRFGGRKVLPLALAFAAFGSFLFGSTSDFWVAAMGRTFMGMGSAFAFVGALYVATNWFPEKNFAMLSGITTMLGMVGAFAGQGPTAYIVKHTGWQVTWVGAAIAGGVLSILLLILVPNRPKWVHKVKKPHKGSNSTPPIFTNMGRVLKNPQTWIIGLYGGLIYVPTSTFAALWGVPFLEAAYQLSKITAATAVSMIFLGWTVGAPLAGWWSDKVKRRKPVMLLGSLGVLILATLLIYVPGLPLGLVFSILFFIGVFSGGQVVCFATAYEANPRNAKGSSLAITNMLVMITGAILQPAVGWLLDLRYQPKKIVGTLHFTASDFHFALMVVPITLTLALFFALLIRETHGKPPKV